MARFVFMVSPRDDGWAVRSGDRVLERHSGRATTVDAGIRWARAHRPSVLMVMDGGSVVEHWRTYDRDSTGFELAGTRHRGQTVEVVRRERPKRRLVASVAAVTFP